MRPRLTVLTLAVADLERAFGFYHAGLGWPSAGIVGREFEHGAVAFFDLEGGVRLALWAAADLAHETGLAPGGREGGGVTRLSLGHNVATRAEVDAVMAAAGAAGARVIKPAQETFWGGYGGYFADPDGHLWEVVWNPALLPAD